MHKKHDLQVRQTLVYVEVMYEFLALWSSSSVTLSNSLIYQDSVSKTIKWG